MSKAIKAITTAFVLVLLMACGGGGGTTAENPPSNGLPNTGSDGNSGNPNNPPSGNDPTYANQLNGLFLIAGSLPGPGYADGKGTEARFNWITDIATDVAGNVYAVDGNNGMIRKVTPAGAVITLAGKNGDFRRVDGDRETARFTSTEKQLAIDNAGNIYVTDAPTIRRISPSGHVETIAGNGQAGYVDGPRAQAQFSSRMIGIAINRNNEIYACDTGNGVVRKISTDGTVSTLAEFSSFRPCFGLALDAEGNLYTVTAGLYASAGSARSGTGPSLHKITPAGEVSIVVPPYGNGSTWIGMPDADHDGNIYLASGPSLQKIAPDGTISWVPVIPSNEGYIDFNGIRISSSFGISSIAKDRNGNLYFVGPNFIGKMDRNNAVSLFAGLPPYESNQDGAGQLAGITNTHGLARDTQENLYVYANRRIRKIDAAGRVSTVTVNGTAYETISDGYLAVDRRGNLYVFHGSSPNGYVLRRITPEGEVTDVAGATDFSAHIDGLGSAARFLGPGALAVGPDDTLYVADVFAVRKVTAAGEVTTLAGSVQTRGYADGRGASAGFAGVRGIAVGNDGTVYVTDSGNHAVRKITPAGDVTTLAGGPQSEDEGIKFNSPDSIAIDSNNNLYVAEYGRNTIHKITPAGTTSTLIGAPYTGITSPSLKGSLYFPRGLVLVGPNTIAITGAYGYGIVGFRDPAIGSPP